MHIAWHKSLCIGEPQVLIGANITVYANLAGILLLRALL